jgi:hypothetical protein
MEATIQSAALAVGTVVSPSPNRPLDHYVGTSVMANMPVALPHKDDSFLDKAISVANQVVTRLPDIANLVKTVGPVVAALI